MTVREMIEAYKISLSRDRKGNLTGKITCWNAPRDATKIEEIKTRKDEILAVLMADEETKLQAAAEERAKIDAIEGLKEMRANTEAQLRYRYEFNRCMEDESRSSFPPMRPKDRSAELAEMYPRAAAYLKAEKNANSANYRISAIGSRAMEKIVNGTNYRVAMAEMEAELEAFRLEHAFD